MTCAALGPTFDQRPANRATEVVVRGRDHLSYYAALKIRPEAGAAEIRLAYEFLKQSYRDGRKQLDITTIRAAYKTLGDPKQRKAYDAGQAAREPGLGQLVKALRAYSLPIMAVTLAVSFVVLLFLVGPEVRARFVGFDSGDELYWAATTRDLGTVDAYAEAHTFTTGTVAPAYRVRPADGGEPVWYPARDLKRHARQR